MSANAGLLAIILISIVFISIRLAMPIKFDGSYIDEYLHITNGISLFESGKYAYFYDDGLPYQRGTLMSLWVGFWMFLFGKSILVAKLAPISIGIINYFLYLYLSVRLLDKRRFQILSLLLFTLSPWCIFNHFYIRMFVEYELFLLILLVFGYKLYDAIRETNGKRIALFLSLIIVLNILNLIANSDTGKYFLPIASAVMLASLFIYEFNAAPNRTWGLPDAIAGNTLVSTASHRAVVVIVIAALAFIVLDAGKKFEFLMNASLTWTSEPARKYPWLFWEKNGVITAFFLVAVASFWRNSRGFEKIILPVAGALFLIHIVSSEDLQIIRGVLYFMPLYYLTAVIGLSKARYPSEWLWYVVISSLFLIGTVTNVPRSYYWGPEITSEIHYIEYARLYDSVRKNCHGNLIIESAPSTPYIARFHGVNVDYALSAAGNAGKDDMYVIDPNTGGFRTVWGALPVITDINDLRSLNRDVCLVVRNINSKRLLPATADNILQGAEKTWKFSHITLYLLKQETLAGTR